ncbi:MAG TPA: methylmalonyl-CoA mutase [Desulfobacteraceae bacterium]|nr:methylmalonyl-CoA mutase [Desulfobacteraceae bacterium]
MSKRIKAVISKLGLDSHERGAKLVASALKDAGMEVVYLGSFQIPENVVKTAIQEDADIIGLSCHSGEHLTLVPILFEIMKEKGLKNIPVIIGGVIPKENVEELKRLGISGVFTYGTTMEQVVEFVENICSK